MTVDLCIYHGDSSMASIISYYQRLFPDTKVIQYKPMNGNGMEVIELSYELMKSRKEKSYLLILRVYDSDFETYHGIDQSLIKCLFQVDKRIREMLDVITVVRT